MHVVLKVTMVPPVVAVTFLRSTNTTENECVSNSKYQPWPSIPQSGFRKQVPQEENSPEQDVHQC